MTPRILAPVMREAMKQQVVIDNGGVAGLCVDTDRCIIACAVQGAVHQTEE